MLKIERIILRKMKIFLNIAHYFSLPWCYRLHYFDEVIFPTASGKQTVQFCCKLEEFSTSSVSVFGMLRGEQNTAKP